MAIGINLSEDDDTEPEYSFKSKTYTEENINDILEDLEINVLSFEDDWSRNPQTMAQIFITKIQNKYKTKK